jgi:hypothetical protein
MSQHVHGHEFMDCEIFGSREIVYMVPATDRHFAYHTRTRVTGRLT